MAGRKRPSETGDEAKSPKLTRSSDTMRCERPIDDTEEDDDVFSIQPSSDDVFLSHDRFSTEAEFGETPAPPDDAGDDPHEFPSSSSSLVDPALPDDAGNNPDEFPSSSSSSNVRQNAPCNESIIALVCEEDQPASRLFELLPDQNICGYYPNGNLFEYRTHACLIVLNNTAYVIGGLVNNVLTNSVRCLNLERSRNNARWEIAPHLSAARSHHACAVLNGTIFATGGRTGEEESVLGISGTTEMYAPGRDEAWTLIKTAIMSNYRCQHSLVAFKGKLFAFGGSGNILKIQLESSVELIEKYSTEEKEWDKVDEELYPGRINGAAICFDNKIWLLGGGPSRESRFGNSFAKFDGKSFTEKKNPLFKQSREHTSAVVYNNEIYICGKPRGGESTTFEKFSNNKWQSSRLRLGKGGRIIYSNCLAVFNPNNSRVPTTPSVN